MSAPPSILMTADTVGGVWRYALELATWLGARGARIAIATMGARPDRAQREEARSVRGLDLFESEHRLEWMEDPWTHVERAGHWLLELEKKLKPQVVHLNGYAHGSLPWRAPALIVGHSCVDSWFRAVMGQPAPREYDRYRRAVTEGLGAVAAVVAPTQAMLHALERSYGPVWTGRIIPNGVRVARYGGTEKRPFVLSAGRLWDPAKNLRALVAIADRVTWPIVVAGSATPPGHPEALATTQPRDPSTCTLDPGLTALGPLAHGDVVRWMSRAAIYALPAYYEPFGLSVLEAALSGCALVLGDVPSLRETWAGAALFVEPADHDGLSGAITRLALDASLRSELSRRAHARGAAFSADRMGAGYLSLYHELIDGKRPRTALGAVP
jgi:glycosyltransferase involved in cell wall biosynthesis